MISISCMDTIAAASSACLVYSYRVTMAGPVSYSDLLTREENELLFSLLGGHVQVFECVCVLVPC